MKTLEDALAAIEAMKADHEAEKAAILKKNKELIDREKAAKQAADEAEAAREEAANEAAAKAGDVEAIRAQLEKKHKAEIDKLTTKLDTITTELSTHKIDNVINEAITENGVLPHHADILKTFLKTGAQMKDGEAFVGDTALADHLEGFFQSENARHYIAAPSNSGAGAPGATGMAGGHGFTRENIRDPKKEAEWLAMEKTNPVMFKQIAEDTGRGGFLKG